jgi:hypothetical protein
MINSLTKNSLNYIQKCNYGFKEPLAYVALIPVISIVVKLIKFSNYEQQFKDGGVLNISALLRKFEKMCKAHFQCAIIQSFALHILVPGVGSLLALVPLVDATHTFYKAIQLGNATKFDEYYPNGSIHRRTYRTTNVVGW